ncbi:hypothetical protein M2388_002031 [Leucobacter aridicollis]|nr:hypothetical protein [Leucobacter aridicollis]
MHIWALWPCVRSTVDEVRRPRGAGVARGPATLDETMLLDSLRAERRGGGPALG